MYRSIRIASVVSLVAVSAAAAQGPEPRRPGGAPPAAEMLLSNVGQLELTDAQVVRLAAIARRTEARRRALGSAMDSARARFTQPGDSVARRQFRERMDGELRRAEEQMRTDQRDAIAVLTPDQQAKAWNMVANRGLRMRAQGMGMGGRPMGMRGVRPQGGRGMAPRPGMRARPEMRERREGERMQRPERRPGQDTGNTQLSN